VLNGPPHWTRPRSVPTAHPSRQAKLLGTKFINLYTLCADLLSKAMHYDWGLRAIKVRSRDG
jgi:hypothetical protein